MPPQFQVIAVITTDDFDLLERVQKGLGRTFSLDLGPYRSQLRSSGVCVARTATLPDAEEKAQIARGIGADYRILDPQNQVVRQGFGRRGEAFPPPKPGRDDPPTLLGGFNAPTGAPEGPRPPSGLHARVRPSQENPALARTLAGPSLGVAAEPEGADGPTAEFVRPDPSGEVDLLPPEAIAAAPAKPPPPAKPAFDLDSLDADDLVLLDGSREEAPKPSSGIIKQPSAAQMAFAPPDADDELELEEEVRPAPQPEPAAEEVPEIMALADEAVTLEQQAPQVAPRPAPPPAAPPRPGRPTVQRSARRAATAEPVAEAPGRLLFGGWFRARPRLRILVGFVLALGLGSIVPACHARSVIKSRVLPQLEDLSTAKAHGQILSRLPNYRSPEAIEEEISGIKTRGGIMSFILWTLIGGGLAFAWFRFT